LERPESRKDGDAMETRGREARLRAEYEYLYPGIQAGTWAPVETLLRHVATLLYGDPGRAGVITGRRLLRQDQFEFRGTAPRPEGLPSTLSRLTVAGTDPE
jgi:hypothetical protein